MIDYVIKSQEAYTEKIGELVSMLEHVRSVTLAEIAGLSQEELDYNGAAAGNSIGALLSHIAAIEKVHQVISFEDRDFNQTERVRWEPALMLGEKARGEIKDHPLGYYLEQLAEVRKETLGKLHTQNDEWLMQEKKWPNGIAYNNYYLWFHVLEDEISHRGQIRLLKRNLPGR